MPVEATGKTPVWVLSPAKAGRANSRNQINLQIRIKALGLAKPVAGVGNLHHTRSSSVQPGMLCATNAKRKDTSAQYVGP